MWNPFEKKEKEFKLDEESLPSLSDTKNEGLNDGNNIDSTMNSNPSNSSIDSDSSLPEPQQTEPIDLSMSSSNTIGGEGMTSTYHEQVGSSSNNNSVDNSSIHQDISKAKMETMEAKMSLIEAKLSSVDQKLELLNQMIYSEISDETKKKFKIDAMMKKIKE